MKANFVESENGNFSNSVYMDSSFVNSLSSGSGIFKNLQSDAISARSGSFSESVDVNSTITSDEGIFKTAISSDEGIFKTMRSEDITAKVGNFSRGAHIEAAVMRILHSEEGHFNYIDAAGASIYGSLEVATTVTSENATFETLEANFTTGVVGSFSDSVTSEQGKFNAIEVNGDLSAHGTGEFSGSLHSETEVSSPQGNFGDVTATTSITAQTGTFQNKIIASELCLGGSTDCKASWEVPKYSTTKCSTVTSTEHDTCRGLLMTKANALGSNTRIISMGCYFGGHWWCTVYYYTL